MNDNNQLPQSSESNEEIKESGALASRWDRLGAAIIDAIIGMCVMLPLMYFSGGLEGISKGIEQPIEYKLIMNIVGIIVFVMLHGALLATKGQTIGKKIIGIKIVDLNGDLPKIQTHLLKRYAVYFILGLIPTVGAFLSFLNILFIFGKEKRCVHDYIAGTKVVNS
ncbi:hypothetical protein GCM10011613_16170 [Cellvibrio zantedeschiae]|uniref:RDD domain-containing protein n=1 Tax=Cellvibrio zantedeschiae TaxID=1237077 RepID=A0ABQ3AZU6_9GAMM|nr:RDD family protein [Cellvibrio zantedeschiae]GGY72010.1 hypothetical protein GCM10011613_16170 [Cellvibrio zantedeschiae]